jgi:hypothetical protein
VSPLLKVVVELKRQYANYINPDEEPYHALFSDYEPYIEFETMEQILENLKHELTELVERVKRSDPDIETGAFKGEFPEKDQLEVNREIVGKLGFDWNHGRLDVSAHPFTSGNQFDCRITTRFNEENLAESILPSIHECGHALYQLGLPQDHYGTPLGDPRDLSIHESQSRLWENHVGRSREFWEFILPELKERFPALQSVTVDDCYESVNQVYEDNPIRVNADELTYHLHIIIRFEIERDLVNGEIEVDQLPEIWNRKMENYLGFPGGISIEDFTALMHAHVREVGCDLVEERVAAVTQADTDDEFVVETQTGEVHSATYVIAAAWYDGSYLRELNDEDMFEEQEHHGEIAERFDPDYPDEDGRTPIDGLYVASPAGARSAQAIVVAGHGAHVARRLLEDRRSERGYTGGVAPHYDWLRSDNEFAGEWADRERWSAWFDNEMEADLPEDRLAELREAYIDRAFDTRRTDQEVEAATERGLRRLVEIIGPNRLLDVIDDDLIRERASELDNTETTNEN